MSRNQIESVFTLYLYMEPNPIVAVLNVILLQDWQII